MFSKYKSSEGVEWKMEVATLTSLSCIPEGTWGWFICTKSLSLWYP